MELQLICQCFRNQRLLQIFPIFTHSPPLYRAPPPQPSPHCFLCPWAMRIYAYMFFGKSLLVPMPHPSEICQSVPCSHASGVTFFINLRVDLHKINIQNFSIITFIIKRFFPPFWRPLMYCQIYLSLMFCSF